MAKGFAAGYAPLGVVAAKDEIVEVVNESGGFLHGHTYAGNPPGMCGWSRCYK